MVESVQLFEQAMQHHRQGKSADAEALYRRVTHLDPEHAQAHFLLSVLALERGDDARAERLLRRAIDLAPTSPVFRCNLGVILRKQGRLDDAAEVLLEAVALKPDLVETTFNLALTLEDKGEAAGALACYERIADLKPDLLANQLRFARALATAGQLERAVGHYHCAQVLSPESRECREGLSDVLRRLGCGHAAQIMLKEDDSAITPPTQRHSVQAILERGLHFEKALDHESAARCFAQYADFEPDDFDIQLRLGRFWGFKKEYPRALAHYQCALILRPNSVATLGELAGLLVLLERSEPGCAFYARALALEPSNAELHRDCGRALSDVRHYDQAIAHLRKAIELAPSSASYASLASSLLDIGLVDEAISAFRFALELAPDNQTLHSNIVYALAFSEQGANDILPEARKWNERHARPVTPKRVVHQNDRVGERRLRIGYVSPDFRDHCQSFFTIPLLEHHDRGNHEIFCYSSAKKRDQMTDRIQGLADTWREILDRSDEQAAKIIQNDGVDILVDLTMHMNANRLLLFARKPAPIQVCWLAYPGTTGLAAMDYRLTDPFLDPPGGDETRYSERTLRLPHTFWCYDPLRNDDGVAPLPALRTGRITFGCLNDLVKTNRAVFALWARVMRRVDGSHLVLLAPEGTVRQRVTDIFREGGIDSARLEFVDRRPRAQYLELYRRIDIGLDPFPYNGHTTSLDAFWMGVPVVTLVGGTIVGRAGLSVASNLALPELMATTPDELIERTVALTSNLARLGELRAGLRRRMEASPLMNAPMFARDVEAIYRHIWREYCEG